MQRPNDASRVLADRYELHERMGAGGSGTVWRGHDRALDRPVAIKLLHADLADDPVIEARFRTEATAAAKLTHPHAVQVYDVGRDDDVDFLVMELVAGVSLADLLREGPVPAGVAAAIGAMVAEALGAAHQAGIVHRDVKPANVLLAADGAVKLADFGIARVLGAVSSRLTRTGTVLGTARYLAPEQLREEAIDARADVYALGLVLYESLTGRLPFGDGSQAEVATRRLTMSLPSVRAYADVPPGLDEVIRWATRRDPEERPPTGAALAEALAAFARDDAADAIAKLVVEHPPTTTETTPTRRHVVDDDALGRTAAMDAVRPFGTGPTDGASGYVAARARSEVDPPPPPQPSPPARDVARPRTAVPRWVLAAGVVLVALLVGFALMGGEDSPGPAEDPNGAASPGEPADPVSEVPITSADVHDPPPGDGRERTGEIANAVDGDADTFWPTESYNTADLGGLKDGVGLWFSVDGDAEVARVDVSLSRAGGAFELWVGDGPPDDAQLPEDWGTLVVDGSIEADELHLEDLPPDMAGDTLLLWFTDLPPGGNGYRVEVRDVRVYAP